MHEGSVQRKDSVSGAVHTVTVNGRRRLEIVGADDVISFDEKSIVLHTVMGLLTVDGEELHILQLNTGGSDGTMVVEGKLCGVFYVDEAAPKQRGLFGRHRD